MDVSIKTYPAKNGDCFLISFGNEKGNQKHILINCGFTETVNNYIIDDLKKISSKSQNGANWSD